MPLSESISLSLLALLICDPSEEVGPDPTITIHH